jgi:hypothetical protein
VLPPCAYRAQIAMLQPCIASLPVAKLCLCLPTLLLLAPCMCYSSQRSPRQVSANLRWPGTCVYHDAHGTQLPRETVPPQLGSASALPWLVSPLPKLTSLHCVLPTLFLLVLLCC